MARGQMMITRSGARWLGWAAALCATLLCGGWCRVSAATGVFYEGRWLPLASFGAAERAAVPEEGRPGIVNLLYSFRGGSADGSGAEGVAGSIIPGTSHTIWRLVEIVARDGAAPERFTSESDVLSAAGRGLISLRRTEDLYAGQFVGEATAPRSVPDRSGRRPLARSESGAAVSLSPNPLNPSATLVFSTIRGGPARASVYSVDGRRAGTLLDVSWLTPGRHELRIDGRGGGGSRLASGVYFFRLDTADGAEHGRFTILK
jgi:hypothetical protein